MLTARKNETHDAPVRQQLLLLLGALVGGACRNCQQGDCRWLRPLGTCDRGFTYRVIVSRQRTDALGALRLTLRIWVSSLDGAPEARGSSGTPTQLNDILSAHVRAQAVMGCGSSSAAQNAESHGADAGVSPDSLLVKKGAAEGTATDGQGNGAKAPADTYDEAKAIALCGAPADCAEVAHMRESGALSRLVSALNDLAVQHGKGAITLEERDSRASELASKALRDATAEVSRAVTKQASRSRAVAVGPRLEALAQSVGDGSVTAEAAREIAMRIVQGVLDDEERAKLIAGISADARAVFGFEARAHRHKQAAESRQGRRMRRCASHGSAHGRNACLCTDIT